jgi:glucokinase
MPPRRSIGVDMGGSKLLTGAVDSELFVHHRTQHPLLGLDQAGLIDLAVASVEEAREQTEGEVAAVGFGIPCLIDRRTGRARMAVNLPLADVQFADVLSERLDLPVYVDNDANLAALAEHLAGAAAGCSEAVILTIGTGIGGGLILGGQLFRGGSGFGAELGHMVIEVDGPRCQGNCPNRGCFESLASGTALAREARHAADEKPDSALGRALAEGYGIEGPLVTELAHDGDAAAIGVLELVGTRLGVAISSFVNIFNPEVVVIGGGVMAAGDLLLEPARAVVAERALPPPREEVRIVPAEFGVEAGMVGAAALAFEGLGEPVRPRRP